MKNAPHRRCEPVDQRVVEATLELRRSDVVRERRLRAIHARVSPGTTSPWWTFFVHVGDVEDFAEQHPRASALRMPRERTSSVKRPRRFDARGRETLY